MDKRYNEQGLEIRVEPYEKTPYLKNTIYCLIFLVLYMVVIYMALTDLARGY